MQTELGSGGVDGLARGDLHRLAGGGELDPREIGAVQLIGQHLGLFGLLDGLFLDIDRRGPEGFLVIAAHVEAVAAQQMLDRIHVGRGATAEDLALHEVRRDHLEHRVGEVAAIAGPGLAGLEAFTDDVHVELRHAGIHELELTPEDDVARAARTVHEGDVHVGIGIEVPARHRHQGRDTHATGQHQNAFRRVVDAVEVADRAVHRQHIAFIEVVVQPVGDQAARHALDGDREAVGHRR